MHDVSLIQGQRQIERKENVGTCRDHQNKPKELVPSVETPCFDASRRNRFEGTIGRKQKCFESDVSRAELGNRPCRQYHPLDNGGANTVAECRDICCQLSRPWGYNYWFANFGK